MAGQQFQYDDSGNTFFYFLTSFVGLIVIPATYYFWPRDQNAGKAPYANRLPAKQLHIAWWSALITRLPPLWGIFSDIAVTLFNKTNTEGKSSNAIKGSSDCWYVALAADPLSA